VIVCADERRNVGGNSDSEIVAISASDDVRNPAQAALRSVCHKRVSHAGLDLSDFAVFSAT
jgi:hypothetical protein